MSWAKIDDELHANEKFAGVSLAATGLWTLCLSWTCHQLKDGFVPASIVRRFAGADSAVVAELVEAGLWEEVSGGYRFHDYLAYNPPAEKVLAEREAARERMGRRRSDTIRRIADDTSHEEEPNNSECSPELRPNFAPRSPSPEPDPLGIHTTLVRNGTQCAGAGPPEGRETTSRPTRRDTPPEQPAERPPTPPGTRPRPQASLPTTTREDYAPPGKASPPPPRGRGPTLRDARPETRRDREAFIAATLAQADVDPERRHWRAALADTLAHAAPREPDRYQASILAAWLAGESLPPQPAAAPRAVTMQDMEAFYGLAPGEQMTPGPFPSVLAAEAERNKTQRAAELQALADRARAADPRPAPTPEVNP